MCAAEPFLSPIPDAYRNHDTSLIIIEDRKEDFSDCCPYLEKRQGHKVNSRSRFSYFLITALMLVLTASI